MSGGFELLPLPWAGVEVVPRNTEPGEWVGTPAEQAARLEALRDALAAGNPEAIREAVELVHRLALVLREQSARASGRRERNQIPDGAALWTDAEAVGWKPHDMGRELSAALGVRAGKEGRRTAAAVAWEHAALAAMLNTARGTWPDGTPYTGRSAARERAAEIGDRLGKDGEHIMGVLKGLEVRHEGGRLEVNGTDPLPEAVRAWCRLVWPDSASDRGDGATGGGDSSTNVPHDRAAACADSSDRSLTSRKRSDEHEHQSAGSSPAHQQPGQRPRRS